MSVIAVLFVITAISGNESYAWGSNVAGTNDGSRRLVHNDAPHVRNIFRPDVILASRPLRYAIGGLFQDILKLRADIPELVNDTKILREHIGGQEQFVELEMDILFLVNVTQTFQERLSQIDQQVEEVRAHLLCNVNRGVEIDGKCYFAVIHEREDIDFEDAEIACFSLGGRPADIQNVSHQNALEAYVQDVMPASQDATALFVGMKYNLETREIQSPSGVVRSLRWRRGTFSSSPGYTAVKMLVHRDPTRGQDLFNDNPSSETYGIICD